MSRKNTLKFAESWFYIGNLHCPHNGQPLDDITIVVHTGTAEEYVWFRRNGSTKLYFLIKAKLVRTLLSHIETILEIK